MPGPYKYNRSYAQLAKFKLDKSKLNRDFREPSEEIPPESQVAPENYKETRNEIMKSLWYDFGIAAWKRKGPFGDFEESAYEPAHSRFNDNGSQMFEMTPDGKTKNPFKDPDIRLDSDEFVKKVQQGKIFAFPVGQQKPSQLQLINGKLEYSKPLEPTPEPQPPQPPPFPRRPGPFARFMHSISKSLYKKEFDNYDAAMDRYREEATRHAAAMERHTAEADKIRKINAGIEKETDRRVSQKAFKGSLEEYTINNKFLTDNVIFNPIEDYVEPERQAEEEQERVRREQERVRQEEERVRREQEQERARAEQRAADMKTYENAKSPEFQSELDKKTDAMMNYYSPKPKQEPSFTVAPGKAGPYTQEQFDTLKPIDVKDVKIGGKPLTDKQFASLSILASTREDIGGNVRYEEGAPLSKKDWMPHIQTTFTCDLGMNKRPDGMIAPRDDAGQYFGQVVQPARKYAKEALDEYNNGNPEKLGRLIAEGIQKQVRHSEHASLTDPAGFTDLSGSMMDMAAYQSVELLENDPTLMQAAEKAGLEQADLYAMKGAKKITDVIVENERAKTLLKLDAESETVKLTEQERKECVQSRLRFEAVNKNIQDFEAEIERKPSYQEGLQKVAEKRAAYVQERMQREEAGNPIPASETTKRMEYFEAEAHKHIIDQKGIPSVYLMVGAHGLNGIDKLTEVYLPGKDKLQNLQGKDLQDALEPNNLFDSKSPYREPPAPEVKQEQRTVQRTVQKTVQQGGMEAGF